MAPVIEQYTSAQDYITMQFKVITNYIFALYHDNNVLPISL